MPGATQARIVHTFSFDAAADKRSNALLMLDRLFDAGVPVHAFGVRAHLTADGYAALLAELASRWLSIFITGMDVLDDGLSAVAAVMTFGHSDRNTWLQEDYPREDGEPRRPLPFDDALQPKPAYDALLGSLENAASRTPLWVPPRAE